MSIEAGMRIVNRENQIARSFRLVIGLREGYEGGILHSTDEVVQAIGQWLAHQRQSGGIYLPGSVTLSTMVYARRSDNAVIHEPVALYDGEVSPEYNADKSDEQILTALQDLSGFLSRAFKQQRVYLRYRETLLILEQ
jgi:hypothetical protein